MLRRTFLLGTAAALAAQQRHSPEDLGSLAFIRGGTLWIRRLPDGEPRAIAAGKAILEPRFSPSGDWILFHEGDDLLRVVSSDGKRGRSWSGVEGQWLPGLDELALSQDDRAVVLSPDEDWNAPRMTFTERIGAVSPDRTRRVWVSSDGDRRRLLFGLLDGSEDPQTVDETREGGFQVLGFARGGSRFLYWMTDEEGADVWSYPLDIRIGGGPEVVKAGVASIMGDGGNMASLSPVSDTLAAAVGGDNLYSYDKSIALVDVSSDANVRVRRITGPSVAAIHPAWSPDGESLAWTQAPDARNEQPDAFVRQRRLWVAGERGLGRPKQLTGDAGYADEAPVWSRDGRYILFSRTDAEDTGALWLMRSDGSGAREAAAPTEGPEPLYLAMPSLFDWSFRW